MSALRRRLVSMPALLVAAVLLLVLCPLWVPIAAVADLVRGRTRLPTLRLLAFGLCWTWLETAGVAMAAVAWLAGQRRNRRLHYWLQRWWAARLMDALKLTTGIRIEAAEAGCFRPGPAVLLCRHASLADSLVSAWVITSVERMHPHYVLKRELLSDPCLDVVGNRLPNHFLDREAADSTLELDALRHLSSSMGADDIAVIFPEGTRAAGHKRERAMEKLAERDPERARRLASLQHVLPPRPAGSAAIIEGCPAADVVFAWHVGFDGLDTFGGILRHLAHHPRPVQFHARRVARGEVPSGAAFTEWLDDQWVRVDRDVHLLLHPEGTS